MSLYPTIGAENLVEKYSTPTGVAVALIEGKLEAGEEYFAHQVVDKVIMAAAKARLELGLKPKRKPGKRKK